MLPQVILIEKGGQLTRVVAVMSALSKEKPIEVTIKEAKRKRSESQNAKLWAIYDNILKVGGEALAGWTKEELHEFFLGNHFGWEVKKLWGKTKQRPKRRSSKLNKLEFSDFLESIYRFMAEQGVFIA